MTTRHKPPPDVARRARLGLALARQSGMVVHWHYAMALARRVPLPRGAVERMQGYFRAHERDRHAVAGWEDVEHPSPEWLRWLLHGGDPGRLWAEEVLSCSES